MATINNTISLQDRMSKTLNGIIKKLEQTQRAMSKMSKQATFDDQNMQVALIKAQAAVEAFAQTEGIAIMQTKKLSNQVGKSAGMFDMLNKRMIAQFSIGAIIANFVMSAIYGLGGVVKEAIQTASAMVEVQNVINVAYKENAKVVDAWAKHTLDAFGINELNAKKYAGTMSAMLQSSGVTTKQAGDMSMKLVELSGDLASFYNLKTDETFKKIRSGMSGMVMPLRSLGIDLSVATMQTHAFAMGIKEKWKNLSQAQKELVRYDYLMKTTSAIQGDFSRTFLSFANQQRLAQENWQMFTASLANNVLPALAAGLLLFNNTIKAMYGLGQIIKIISPFLIWIGSTVLLSLIPPFIKWIQAIWVAGAAFRALKWEALLTWISIYAPLLAVVGLVMLFVWWMKQAGHNFAWLTGQIGWGVGYIVAIWDNMVTRLKVLWQDWASFVLEKLLKVANAVDMVLPTNISNPTASMLNSVRTMKVGMYQDPQKTADNFKNDGIQWGRAVQNTLGALFKQPNFPTPKGGFGNPANPGEALGGKGKKGNPLYTKMDDNDIKALVEVAKVNYVNKFIKMKPELNVKFGDVHQNADVNNIISVLADALEEAHNSALSGAY